MKRDRERAERVSHASGARKAVTGGTLILRALRHYWRTNLAVIAGVATAVAVLAGALLVGDSVRGSLRDLVLQRLGRADRVVIATGFFREALAADLGADPAFAAVFNGVAPLIVVEGAVTGQAGRRATRVQIYGVDDRFWRFHGVSRLSGPANPEAFVSDALAADTGAAPGAAVLVRIERPSAIPIESLHGRKEDTGRTLRLTVRAVLDRSHLGEFSLLPQQGAVRAIFVPLTRLQRDLEQPARINAMIVSDSRPSAPDALDGLLRRHTQPGDFGLSVRVVDAQHALALESPSGLIDRPRAAAAERAAAQTGMTAMPVLSYLANTIRDGDREVPYSLVSALDLGAIDPSLARSSRVPADGRPPPIVLNEWAARDLRAAVGDAIALDYYVWQEPGYLETRSARFTLAAIVPIAGLAADRDLVPAYPGITAADSVSAWDPPFPIDLKRVRPADEKYWKQYRTTPRAFIAFEAGRSLWQTRFGDRTSMRILPPAEALSSARDAYERSLTAALDPATMGFAVRPVRADGLAAARGATDFGEYFVYFSFFLVVSALVLAALFFRLGVEQRAREVGLLRAVGFSTPRIRRLFTAEALALAFAGSLAGMGAAVAYGAVMMAGLRTWWSGAVGTTALALHVSPVSLLAGATGALVAAVACIWWALGSLAKVSERRLLAGEVRVDDLARLARLPRRSAAGAKAGLALAIVAVALISAASLKRIDPAGAFFGAGAAILIACLCFLSAHLRRLSPDHLRQGYGGGSHKISKGAIARLGIRNTSERPGRTILAVAVIASAVFVLISVDAFRRGTIDSSDRASGTGGYPLLVDLMLPIVHDPNTPDGRDALGLPEGAGLAIEPLRALPGEDASCLNLYEPRSPRVVGVSRRFIDAGRFSFHSSLAADPSERANPWRLLDRTFSDGAIPVIADANSMTYVLHKKLGDDVVAAHGGAPVRLRLVAALSDSIFQGELLMSDARFIAAFPEQQGYRVLLVDAPADRASQIGATIERTAGDLGADAVSTRDRLAEFHAVENTYLSTFQTLGGLGLLVGTIGLAAVLLRNVLERRRELALLRAVGYGPRHLFAILLAENAMLLIWGLAAGTLSAIVAIAPAALERGARLPLTPSGAALILAVLAAGLLSSALATRAALGWPLVAALRSE